MLGLRHRIAWIAALAALLAAAVALGAPTQVRTFGEAGGADGTLGPHAAGIAVAPDGTVYVADRQQGRVEVFANGGAPIAAWGDFDGPTAIALDGARVLVGDARGVRAFSTGGELLADLGGPASPGGIAVGPGGTVFATDTAGGRVVRLGGGTLGAAELIAPTGIAVGSDGDLYVADPGSASVKRFSAAGTLEDGWPASDPQGIAIAADGTLYLAEGQAHRVGRFHDDGVRLADVGADGPLNVPRGVALDCRGALYVVDNSNPRGHVFAEPGTAAPPCPVALPAPVVAPAAVEAEPEVGRTARATVLNGTVFAGRGQSRRRLSGRVLVPIGEQIDAGAGTVRLEFEAIGADRQAYGRLMDADFDSGEFTIHQARDDSLVEIALIGVADVRARAGQARAAAKRRRRVWSRARGRFRTRGNHGAATVRGTRWLTEERDRGTYFRVTEGSIVVREFRSGESHVLTAPDSFLARAPCASRRRFRIRLRPPAGTTVSTVKVRVAGKRVPVRRGRRLTALVDLRGRPKGRVVVRIAVRTADGRLLRGKRVYHTCRKGQRRAGIPEL